MTSLTEQNQNLGMVLPNLVNYPIANTVAWTVSLPRRHQIDMVDVHPHPVTAKRREWLYWFELGPRAQWNFIKYCYLPSLFKYCGITKCYVVGEINKRKDVHAHAIIYSDDPEWDVATFISFCSHHVNALNIHHHKNEHRLNFIHTVKDKYYDRSLEYDWYEYIMKYNHIFRKMIPYYIGANVKSTILSSETCNGSTNDENATDPEGPGSDPKAEACRKQGNHKSCRKKTRSLFD